MSHLLHLLIFLSLIFDMIFFNQIALLRKFVLHDDNYDYDEFIHDDHVVLPLPCLFAYELSCFSHYWTCFISADLSAIPCYG